jgi:hypothetical protein
LRERDRFLERLRKFRVLDPACGSGNFLYLALLALKDLEHRALIEAEALGLGRVNPSVGPEAVLGIEVNAYAAELLDRTTGKAQRPKALGRTYLDALSGCIRLAAIPGNHAAHIHAFVGANIAPGATPVTDGHASYSGIPGYRHDPRIVGNMAAHIPLKWIHPVFALLKRWSLGTYHGLRRRHIDAYLSEFVFRYNRRFYRHVSFETVLAPAAHRSPLSDWDITGRPNPRRHATPIRRRPRHRKTAGGSSSGSAAAVGTDTGGSIRIPSAYCGIVGLKPTFSPVRVEGIAALAPSTDRAGPMAASVADARALLAALAGRSFACPPSRGWRLAVVPALRDRPSVLPGARRAFDAACAALAAAGAAVEEVDVPEIEQARGALDTIIYAEASVAHAPRYAAHPEGFSAPARADIAHGFGVAAVDYVRAQAYRARLRERLESPLAARDALLWPTAPWVAPAEGPAGDVDARSDAMRLTAPPNLTGQPALTVPCGLAEGGMPAGIQLLGPLGSDARLLDLGAEVERLRPLPPNPYAAAARRL